MGGRRSVTKDMWEHALAFLPEDLDTLARETGSVKRPRRVESAAQLLRALLLYAEQGSFRTAAALSRSTGLLDITPEGLFYRLRHSEKFLEALLSHLSAGLRAPAGYRLLVVDATTVCGPGATGTDWRVHVGYDPVRALPCSIYVGDASVGESLARHELRAGMLVLGDRAYGTARNVHHALGAGADVLVRVQRKQMRLLQASGERVDWDALEAQVPSSGAAEFPLDLPVPPDGAGPGAAWHERDRAALHPVRLVGTRNLQGETVWLLTSMPSSRLDSATAAELYRVRWQIELYFKRLKSLGDLDVLGSRDGPTARSSVLAKMILLTLAGLLSEEEQAFSPYGYPVRQKPLERVPPRPQKARRRSLASKAATKETRAKTPVQPEKAQSLP
jgi:hypothetical protein